MRKLVKLAAGLALAGVGGYVVLMEGVAVVSSDAVVNARVAVVRAPIDGLLTLQPRSIGERVQGGQPLGVLNDVRADEARLLELERAAGALEADIARLQAQVASNTASRDLLRERTEAYRDGRIRQLKSRIDEQQALLSSAKAQSIESGAALQRAEELRDRGVQSAAVLDKAQAANEVNALTMRAATARLESLRTELEAANKGMFLGDSYNDTPYSSQRAQELDLRLAELDADLEERTRRLATTREQIALERQRVARLRDAFLASPVDGLVWETLLGNGEHARKGQDLLRLLDCSTVMVTASVSESDYNRLKVGDPARFRLSGTDRTFDGQVLRLAGSGAATIYNSLAIAPGPEHLKRFDVALAVPGLLDDPEAGCAVGRTGKVVFSGTPRELLRTVGSWLGML
ncbi:HlyD family secretion protein [Azospirillum sp. ST 5-10]|uniref:HlyD family secretion protein n=1 Tax=unclassified Azospirillum TaxID=2630922 RepID=UPI003F49F7B1